jgi:hypothetical protein
MSNAIVPAGLVGDVLVVDRRADAAPFSSGKMPR